MSISYNKVVLVGRLTRDPEIKFSTSGTQISLFTLAVDRPMRSGMDDSGNTDFIKIVSFGKLAEFAGNYLTKGRLVLVEGSLRIRKWKTADGDPRSTVEIVANAIRFLETRSQVESTPEVIDEPEEKTDLSDDITFFGSEPADTNDDDIPF
ncbi:single-stranded DNA-binding protein [Kosmotoga arenicorallina S304]|uniref:Single-stranded DNA-binding protein n=1 Tax=Kosmotoga arenicorallina S304 TaxID=1453497 RepID=A0A176K0I0_9BACT|nr:single-stranded DNA-binding protein [Kosmotoga arenicorallina]OAA30129.1 single-stranded DNA-binding protein [Kosmotoga arenicorallina S304]